MADQIVTIATALVLAGGAYLITITVSSVVGFVRSKLAAQDFEILSQIAMAAVKAAEQSPGVQNKKQAALDAAVAILNDLGLRVSAETLEAAIEAAVLEAFNSNYASFVKVDRSEPEADF